MTTHDTIPSPPPSGVVPRVLAPSLALFKTCACGRAYTLDEWTELPFVGLGEVEADAENPAEPFEMRNCVCGSTIAVSPPTGAP